MSTNKNKKLWGGRFKQSLAPPAKKLSYSLAIDKRLATYDIKVNIAHAKALKKAGYLSQNELIKATTFLKKGKWLLAAAVMSSCAHLSRETYEYFDP